MATVYILKSADGSFPECYIGKTTGTLSARLAKHKYETKRRAGGVGALAPVSSARLFEKGAVIIEAIEENIPLATVNGRERFYIETMPHCVNMKKSYDTPKEAVDAFNNSEARKQYMKEYAAEHKEAVSAAKKKYKEKEQNTKILCDVCEVLVSKRTMRDSHLKSKKHLDRVAAAAPAIE